MLLKRLRNIFCNI